MARPMALRTCGPGNSTSPATPRKEATRGGATGGRREVCDVSVNALPHACLSGGVQEISCLETRALAEPRLCSRVCAGAGDVTTMGTISAQFHNAMEVHEWDDGQVRHCPQTLSPEALWTILSRSPGRVPYQYPPAAERSACSFCL
jgi:hypothetical protein